VGQGTYEEVDFKPAGGGGGWNWGWSQREGAHPFSDGTPCASSGIAHTDPIAEYQQGSPKAVTGGFVYRGILEPDLVGHYIFTDFYSGSLWSLANGVLTSHGSTGLNISSFGESEAGELYAVDLPAGQLYRVVGPPFIDIASSQFYYDILWIYGQGITTGCGNRMYCPDQAVTRQEMASFLVRALDIPPTGTDFFTDDEASIHEADINALAAHGTTTGCGGGRYCPDQAVTRQEMASFLVRALDIPPTSTDFFTDDETSIHEADINALAAHGTTTGCGGGRYCPLDSVTRGEMAAFLHRALT
ncbi:MAG: S-layer homology domain-containing protein, partial [Candidatus Limnocylindria bacterium]